MDEHGKCGNSLTLGRAGNYTERLEFRSGHSLRAGRRLSTDKRRA